MNKGNGLTMEKTTELLEIMTKAGIPEIKASINLKTCLTKLSAAGLTLDEGFKKVADSKDKLVKARLYRSWYLLIDRKTK